MPVQFDNHDERIKYYELLLERDLEGIPVFPLPDGYRFVFYSQGDEKSWIEIEMSARELTSYEQGMEVWNNYYGEKEDTLPGRMVFIENADGEKVATATAYYDVIHHDASGDGWLHWVAVRRKYQGKGLSKPLISHALGVMRGLGYTHAKIPTQTTTWLACKIYLDFGFTPEPLNAARNAEGWGIVKALTNHRALETFRAASFEEILVDVKEKD